MTPERHLFFPPFHLDTAEERLRRDAQVIFLRPKTFGLLRYLTEHPGQLVTKEELLSAVWSDAYVSEGVLTVCMTELRKALGDDAKTPQFIETVHRRGYRFIAPITTAAQPPVASSQNSVVSSQKLATGNWQLTTNFVGREQEMAALRSSLENAVSGRGRLMLLVGEPGIGKTRTADELATYARSRNAQVFIGRCYEGEGAPPFWPWVQIVRAYLSDHDSATLRAAMGSGAADIAQVIPDVHEQLPDLPVPPVLEPEPARFRFFDSFTTFLKNGAKAQLLVLILDDLHWADTPSLLLLQFLARELSNTHLLVIGTYRDVELGPTHPLTQALGELARVPDSQSLFLRCLTESEISRFIELTTAQTLAPSLVTAVFQKTGGNPFFVTEVVHTLVRDGRSEHLEELGVEAVPPPQRVRAAVERRLGTLSEPCRRVLTTASAIGRDFDFTVLESAELQSSPALGGDGLLKILNEAVAARFVVADPRSVGRYSFSHALVRETLSAALSADQRVQLHRRIGEVLEHLASGNPELHPSTSSGQALAELASHFFQAAPGGDIDKAIYYAVRAGEHATTLFAYEEAVAHYERALQLLDLKKSAEVQRCELLLALGEAQRKAGRTTAAKTTFRQVAERARALDARKGANPAAFFLARAALGFVTGFGGVTVTSGVEDAFVVGLLEEALRALGEEDSALRARVLSRLALEIYYSRAPQRQAALSQGAVEIARRIGDTATLAYALHARHVVLGEPGNVEERLATATEIMRLATAVGDKELALRGHLWRLSDLLELGDLQTADREIDVYAQRAEELRQPSYLWFLATWKATRAWLRGHFAEAERWAREALHLGQRAQDPDAAQCFTVQLFGMYPGFKSLQGIELPVQEHAEQYAALPAWRSGLALLYAGFGAKEEARREFEQFAVNDFANIPRDGNWMITLTNLAQVCTILRDQPRAATLYQLLLPYAERCVIVTPALVFLGVASRFLGLLAKTLTRWDEAEAHFVTALRRNTRMGAKPLIALTQQQYAVMLLARKHSGDWEQAMALLEQALATAQELGMDDLEKRVLTIRTRGQSSTPQRREYGAPAASPSRKR